MGARTTVGGGFESFTNFSQPHFFHSSVERIINKCMLAHMAVKTITIDLEAYGCLSRARLESKESFSKVIKRASWAESGLTGKAWAAGFRSFPAASVQTLDALEENQKCDHPPEDPWQS